VSDTDTALVDSLKVLDPERPIREATELLRRREMTRGATSGLRARHSIIPEAGFAIYRYARH